MKKLFDFNLKFDREVVALTIVSTLLLMIDYYERLTPIKEIDRIALYLLIPLGIIVFAFRRPVGEYGFQLGDWKAGLALTGLVVLIGAPILWYVGRSDPDMVAYYAHQNGPVTAIYTFLDLLGWEFFFRGFLLFGYARFFGANALWLAAVPFALAHIRKPAIETYSTLFGGVLFGLVAWRTKSFVYPFLIHWFVSTFTIFAAGTLR